MKSTWSLMALEVISEGSTGGISIPSVASAKPWRDTDVSPEGSLWRMHPAPFIESFSFTGDGQNIKLPTAG